MTEVVRSPGVIRFEDVNPPEPPTESKLFNLLDKLAAGIGKITRRRVARQAGYYLPAGESDAFAEAVHITADVDISSALRTPEFGLAIEAVKNAEFPSGRDSSYPDLLAAISKKYEDLKEKLTAEPEAGEPPDSADLPRQPSI